MIDGVHYKYLHTNIKELTPLLRTSEMKITDLRREEVDK